MISNRERMNRMMRMCMSDMGFFAYAFRSVNPR